jgi:hypothetical protein
MRRCQQCWRDKDDSQFIGASGRPITWCRGCRELYRSGGRRETRRLELDGPLLRFGAVLRSHNPKLGKMPATMTSGHTCPICCGLRDRGCFGEFGLLAKHWRDISTGRTGLTLDAFLGFLLKLPERTLWRHNVVGDLPGVGDAFDVDTFLAIVAHNYGRRAFTYTHKPMTRELWAALVMAAEQGFIVNVSCDGVEALDRVRAKWSDLPTVVVLPEDAPVRLRSPAGYEVRMCPAEVHEKVNCLRCGICARPDRTFAVGFRAHGQWSAKVSQLVQLRRKGQGQVDGGRGDGPAAA